MEAARALGLAVLTLAPGLVACRSGSGSSQVAATTASPATPTPAPASASGSPSPSSTSSAAPTAGGTATGSLKLVAWLEGSWQGKQMDDAIVDETWKVTGPMTMTGEGKATKGGDVLVEHLRIEVRGEDVIYVATPGGGSTTEFRRDPRISGATFATFVNEAHDWPTHIRYERVGEALMVHVHGRPDQFETSFTLTRR
ncbi:DUF6265 family protein [Polyangium sorediatum]|uniref:DUF6265 family protein n=1 Tax=Polyangium sorediatum TaxID=889274 RepID=A0ABT6P2P9_9BACT|nr:DUF6265 family protein [Polyangium sorediatum]MDI1434829.1 DUF6265 family protein [Polyangium sorediatum]